MSGGMGEQRDIEPNICIKYKSNLNPNILYMEKI